MRISHCILNSIEWDLCETSKGKSLWAEMATFPKFLIRQSTLYFLPFLKLQIKWLRSWPYKSIYHKCRQCHYWEWIIYHWPRLRDIPNAHNRWFIFIFIMCEDPHEYKSIQIAFGSGFTLHLRVHDHTTWFWRCLGTAFGHFLLDSQTFMITALGSCVKWP